jgi:hypothetical protein
LIKQFFVLILFEKCPTQQKLQALPSSPRWVQRSQMKFQPHDNPMNNTACLFLLFQAFTVPEQFPEVLRTLVREILRSQPQSADDINKFGKSSLLSHHL